MCGAASLAAQGAGVAMQTVGAFASASAQQASLRSQARIADMNATISDQAARQTLAASNQQQSELKLRGEQVKSAQRAAYGANGIDVASGSAVNAATSTDYVTEVDANAARANGIMAAWGQRTQATNYRNQALSERASADGISPLLAGATTLLSGATQVASSWYGLNKVGALKGNDANGGTLNLGGSGFIDASNAEAIARIRKSW